ncbi:MAG TPA: hypothetical protein VL400_03185 [Polyangiaceae bacterium]|jgi:hypothetical protein|nr:hypothetical protein [Polyangiaceae bacterium]
MTSPSEPDLDKPAAPAAPGAASMPAGPSSGAAAELFLARNVTARTSWLWVALPVAGLLVVPTVGLVYAATSDFGHGAASSSADALEDGLLPGETDAEAGAGKSTTGAKRPIRSRKTTAATRPRGSQKPRVDGAALCCAKLDELGKTAPLESRGTYLAAARVCEAADDEETAKKQARSAVGAARAEVPDECK